MILLLVSLIPAFFVALPLFGARFIPTHDGEYHLVRFWQFFTMLKTGNLFPRWAPELNFGFGIPLFTFQYPFPNYIGSLFHVFGASFVDSVKWTTALGYFTALLFCFLYVRKVFGKVPAVFATIICSFVPYWFLDMYIRGSVGEIWGIAWVFAALYALASDNRLLTTVAMALIILSHNIMAFIFFPVLCCYMLLFRKSHSIPVLLGLGISSFFWIPAIYEQQFIRGLSPVNIFDYFPQIYQLLIPSWGSGFRGQISGATEMSYQIGVISIIVFTLISGLLIRRKRAPREVYFFVAVFMTAVFFMTPWSIPIWRIVPFIHVVQYPWRLLSFILVATPVCSAYLVTKMRFAWILVPLSMMVTYGYFHPVTYEPRTDEWYLHQSSFTSGTSSLGDAFQTKWTPGSLKDVTYGFFMQNGDFRIVSSEPTEYRIWVTASASGDLTLPVTYYPGWRGSVDGVESNVVADTHGISSMKILSGSHDIQFWLDSTLWQKGAVLLSTLSLSVAILSFILKKRL